MSENKLLSNSNLIEVFRRFRSNIPNISTKEEIAKLKRQINLAACWITESKKIVIFTGAGLSNSDEISHKCEETLIRLRNNAGYSAILQLWKMDKIY